MANPAPSLPGTMRAMNGLFSMTGPIGEKLISLRPDKLMKIASRETGLDDFGPDYFYQALARLCSSMEHDAKLAALGRLSERQGRHAYSLNDSGLDLSAERVRFADYQKA